MMTSFYYQSFKNVVFYVNEGLVDVQQTCTNTSYGWSNQERTEKENFFFQYITVIG